MAEPVKTQAVTLVMFLPAGQIFRAFRDGRGDNDEGDIGIPAVSYTHLTLPTKLEV